MTGPDDLGNLDDTPLTRALRAPGTEAELSERERYLALYRAEIGAGPTPRRRVRGVRRLGAGTALGIALAVGGGGVAAAYAGSLPDPLQRIAHRVLGPIGAPPAPAPATEEAAPRTPRPSPSAEPSPTRSARPTPAPSRSASRSPKPTKARASVQPAVPSDSALVDPTALPTGTPTEAPSGLPTDSPSDLPSGSPTASPTAGPPPTTTASPAPVPTRPVAVVITGTGQQAELYASTTLAGTVLARDRGTVADTPVVLERRGPRGWTRVGAARTDATGTVELPTPPLTQTTSYRWRVGRVHSMSWRIALLPTITVSTIGGGPDDPVTVTVTVRGAGVGDAVRLLAADRQVGRSRLDSGGGVTFVLRPTRPAGPYVVLVPANARHAAARATLDVP